MTSSAAEHGTLHGLRGVAAGSVVLSLVSFLSGAGQIPDSGLRFFLVGWGIPILLVFWARSEATRTGRALPGLTGIWFYVFGFLLIPYYLWRTRHARPAATSVTVLALMLAPMLADVAGALAVGPLQLAPRFIQVSPGRYERMSDSLGAAIVHRDFARLAEFLAEERIEHQEYPADVTALYARWQTVNHRALPPYDPFSGHGYYYEVRPPGYVLWSTGPDRRIATDDDLWYQWPPDSTTP